MTKASDNAFPSVLITEGTEPSAPAAGKQRLYIDSTTHKLMRVPSTGTEVSIESCGAAVATDTIWDAAGDLAVGSGADTAARLAKGAAGGYLAMGNSAVIWNAGTSFPGSKATNDRYFRTDLGMEWYWDGTQWVSTQVFTQDLFYTGATALSASNANPTVIPGLQIAYGIYLMTMYTTMYTSTTLDSGKYWTCNMYSYDAGSKSALIATVTNQGLTASTFVRGSAAINAVLAAGADGLALEVIKTSTPGNFFGGASVTYRLIGT